VGRGVGGEEEVDDDVGRIEGGGVGEGEEGGAAEVVGIPQREAAGEIGLAEKMGEAEPLVGDVEGFGPVDHGFAEEGGEEGEETGEGDEEGGEARGWRGIREARVR
jgi:hypothetical protein